MNGITALALVVICGFAGFILWGKTGTGKRVLRETLGEPAAPPKKPTPRRRSSTASTKRKPIGAKTTGRKKSPGK